MFKLRNFTLVELLVVIAIISILMAMLLPSLKKANDMSKRTVCTSNLKQNGTVFSMYAGDFNGTLPKVIESWTPWLNPWPDVMINSGHFNSSTMKTLACPSAFPWTFPPPPLYSNSWCYAMASYRVDATYPSQHYAWWYYAGHANIVAIPLFKVSNPAEQPLALDSVALGTAGSQTYGAQTFAFNAPVWNVNFRHNNQANILFCDGSARGISRGYAITELNAAENICTVGTVEYSWKAP